MLICDSTVTLLLWGVTLLSSVLLLWRVTLLLGWTLLIRLLLLPILCVSYKDNMSKSNHHIC